MGRSISTADSISLSENGAKAVPGSELEPNCGIHVIFFFFLKTLWKSSTLFLSRTRSWMQTDLGVFRATLLKES